jgi:aspartyl-tRNA(Asn)/glutamyl-tRNA(Gln) amidotransferase subunit B
MEEGSLRCDANISIRPVGETELGTKTELKNMNSFRYIERGIRAEVARQAAMLDAGERIVQETLHFDPRTERLTSMRSKEEAQDYRYFPEPDLVPVPVDAAMLARARAAMPELPAARQARFEQDLGLQPDTAKLLAWRAELGDWFETALAASPDGTAAAVPIANWTTNELLKRLGADAEGDTHPGQSKVTPEALAHLVALVTAKTVTSAGARQVLEVLLAEGGDPARVVEAQGLGAVGGEDTLAPIVAEALAANPAIAERLRGGDMKPMGVIIGHVMKATKGRADGGEVTRLVRAQLGL